MVKINKKFQKQSVQSQNFTRLLTDKIFNWKFFLKS
jgi:hypothetical protein